MSRVNKQVREDRQKRLNAVNNWIELGYEHVPDSFRTLYDRRMLLTFDDEDRDPLGSRVYIERIDLPNTYLIEIPARDREYFNAGCPGSWNKMFRLFRRYIVHGEVCPRNDTYSFMSRFDSDMRTLLYEQGCFLGIFEGEG